MKKDDLTGCPDDLVAAAAQAAAERARNEDDYVITLSRSLVEPFLTFSDRRDLRERAWRAWTSRGELAQKRDNLALAKEILQLRNEQAALHGYASFAVRDPYPSVCQRPPHCSVVCVCPPLVLWHRPAILFFLYNIKPPRNRKTYRLGFEWANMCPMVPVSQLFFALFWGYSPHRRTNQPTRWRRRLIV